MRRTYITAGYVAGLVFLLMGVSFSQSLGDLAREQRQKEQAKKDQAAPKVITNEDLPERAQADDDSDEGPQGHEPVPRPHSAKSAEQWKMQIQGQKKAIELLQRQMDRLSATIHYVEANRYTNGAQHNLRQEQKEAEIGRMQDQMELQKQRLNDMQEAARKDGFGNGIYDP